MLIAPNNANIKNAMVEEQIGIRYRQLVARKIECETMATVKIDRMIGLARGPTPILNPNTKKRDATTRALSEILMLSDNIVRFVGL